MLTGSNDQVYAHGAHGTKCYLLLRGLARVLRPEENPDTGVVRYCPHADLGPGEVGGFPLDKCPTKCF